MKIQVFYHIFCNEKTISVVKDQVTKIIFSGLYDVVDYIHCFVAGDQEIINNVVAYLEKCGNKFKICDVSNTDTSYERFTLTKIGNYVQPDDKFLYIHTKGITKSGEEESNSHDWRTFMEYNLIHNFKECINKLDVFDTVGVNTERVPALHYSGNFWWCKASYYTKLNPNVLNQNFWGSTYLAPEMYILSGNPKAFQLTRSTIKNHYKEPYPFNKYIDHVINK